MTIDEQVQDGIKAAVEHANASYPNNVQDRQHAAVVYLSGYIMGILETEKLITPETAQMLRITNIYDQIGE